MRDEPISNSARGLKVAQIVNLVAGASRYCDLSVIRHLRKARRRDLANAHLLETALLPKLGLSTEIPSEMPEAMERFRGRGILCWQSPRQFSKYLALVSQFPIQTYLEIGARHGGSFIITVEYLQRFHSLTYSIAVDHEYFPSLMEYQRLNPRVTYMLADSQSEMFKDFMSNHPGFDLVFIDGDHRLSACRKDFENVRDKAQICVLHDITQDRMPGPGCLWNRIKKEYRAEYRFFEYTEQYKSIRRSTGKLFYGIGVAVRKSFWRARRTRAGR